MLLLLLRRTETRPEEDAGEEPLRSGTRLGLRVLRGRAESSVSSVGEPNAAVPRKPRPKLATPRTRSEPGDEPGDCPELARELLSSGLGSGLGLGPIKAPQPRSTHPVPLGGYTRRLLITPHV